MSGRNLVTARSLRALDWLNFFVANVQTGFGPFIASYLASHKWTQGEIGMALSVGTISAMVSQVPGGAAVDALRNKKAAAAWAIIAIILSAVLLAASPTVHAGDRRRGAFTASPAACSCRHGRDFVRARGARAIWATGWDATRAGRRSAARWRPG